MIKYVVFTKEEKALAFAKESIEGNCQTLLLGNPLTKAIKVAISIDDSDEEIMLETQIKMYEKKGFVKLNSNIDIKRDWFITNSRTSESLAEDIAYNFSDDIFKIDTESGKIDNVTNTENQIPNHYKKVTTYRMSFNNYQNHTHNIYFFCENNGLFEDSILPNVEYITSQLNGRVINITGTYDKFSSFINNMNVLENDIEFRVILSDDISVFYDFKNMKRIDYDKVLEGNE